MPVIVAIANLKGGSSKSTTAFNLAGVLAERGRRVLLIDVDIQRTVSLRYLGVEPRDLTLSRVLIEEGGERFTELVQPTAIANLYVVPADEGLKPLRAGLREVMGVEYRLRQGIAHLQGPFDLVLIDCPPSLDNLTLNALIAAQYALIPLDVGVGGRGALTDTLAYIEETRKWHNPTLRVLGLLVSNVSRRTGYDQRAEGVLREQFGGLVFQTVIPHSVRVRESSEAQKPMVFYDEHGPLAAIYREWADEVIARLGGQV